MGSWIENKIKIPVDINNMINESQFPNCEEIEKDIGINILGIEKYIPQYTDRYYRNISGSYILVTINGKYIGESTAAVGLIYRLQQHKYSVRIGEILFGYIYETIRDKKVTRKLESYLISRLEPNLNRRLPWDKYEKENPVIRIDKDTYNKLRIIKHDVKISFSDVIQNILSENKRLKEEIDRYNIIFK